MTRDVLQQFIETLAIPDDAKTALKQLTPARLYWQRHTTSKRHLIKPSQGAIHENDSSVLSDHDRMQCQLWSTRNHSKRQTFFLLLYIDNFLPNIANLPSR